MFLERYRRWLRGSFVCRKCGCEFHSMSLGFGGAICPDCYNGERWFIFLERTFWLNRFVEALMKRVNLPPYGMPPAPPVDHEEIERPEIEAANQPA